MSHFYSISIAIIVVTLINLYLASKIKNSWYRKIGMGLNFTALILLVAAIIFKAFNR